MKNIKRKNKIILASILVCLIGLLGVGVSYAYWRFTAIQTNSNTATSKCFSISMTNQNNEINLNNAYPITDEEAKKLTPYSFTLTNTCSMSASYTLSLEMLNGTTLKSDYVAVLLNNGTKKLLSNYDNGLTTLANSTESRVLDTGLLLGGTSKDYTLSLWLDESVTLDDDVMNKTLKSKVVVSASATVSTVDKIIASLDITGKCPTVNEDGSIATPTSIEAEGGYLCSAFDTYGTSYYYRGIVDNNYVYFAGYYWRIVRVNGDGSIRIIYDGKTAHANGEASTDRHIGTSKFNSDYHDNAKVGYMYGNNNGIVSNNEEYLNANWDSDSTYYISKEYSFDETTKKFRLKDPIAVLGSNMTNDYVGYYTANLTETPSYYSELSKITSVKASDSKIVVGYSEVRYGTLTKGQAQTNANSSTIKTYLDNWYQSNILKTKYEGYIVDNIFCNDRSYFNSNSGVGAGTSNTKYRWYSTPNKLLLACPQKNDAFTVADIQKGNGALTYSIGLLTTDEAFLAGGGASNNEKFYLYTGYDEWLMSPDDFSGVDARVRSQDSNGNLDYDNGVDYSIGVRPILNLKSGSLLLGTGTMDDPYRITDSD